MKCLNCGNDSEELICCDCREEKVLEKIFDEIIFFKADTCNNEYVKEYIKKFEKARDARNDIPQILELFVKEISEFYWLRYNKIMRDNSFESEAVKYLKNFDEKNIKQQRVLYDLLTFYIPNDFEKPFDWCRKIIDSDECCPELQLIAAEFFSMIAEYDIAEEIVKKLETKCQENDFKKGIFLNKEKILENIDNRKHLLERYRGGKPYWPSTEERRAALALIYDKKGMSYPNVELKPKKVKESEFERIVESDLNAMDNYCAFWCSGVQTPTRVFVVHQIAAVKVRNNKIVGEFQSYIKPWDGESIAKRIEKKYGVTLDKLYFADNVEVVMKSFFEFVENDVLVSTNALADQAKMITRLARYSNMTKIKNQFFELLDYAADISEKFDLENNSREYLLNHFKLKEGKDSLEKAKKNIDIYNKLKKMGE